MDITPLVTYFKNQRTFSQHDTQAFQKKQALIQSKHHSNNNATKMPKLLDKKKGTKRFSKTILGGVFK